MIKSTFIDNRLSIRRKSMYYNICFQRNVLSLSKAHFQKYKRLCLRMLGFTSFQNITLIINEEDIRATPIWPIDLSCQCKNCQNAALLLPVLLRFFRGVLRAEADWLVFDVTLLWGGSRGISVICDSWIVCFCAYFYSDQVSSTSLWLSILWPDCV